MGTLDDKVAVITGAAGGIGSATAHALAREGAEVVLLDLHADAVDAVAQEVKNAGGAARALACDVSDEESVRAALEHAGRFDILVNNAGVAHGAPLAETTVEDFDRVVGINLRGTFLLIKHAAPRLREGGAIVNIASVAALMAVTGTAAYSASKGGVVGLTRVAAAELAPGVRVNCICPGTVRTAMPDPLLRGRGDGDVEKGAEITARKYLSGRLGEPSEIASTVLFLAGPGSSFLTGSVVVADGGVTAQ